MRRTVCLAALLVIATACGSGGGGSTRPTAVPQPDINVGLTHDIFFGSRSDAPATVAVEVTNRASVPITIRRVEVSSPGMSSWWILPRQQEFREVVNAGQTRQVTMFATAETTTRRPTEPLTLRAIVFFESGGTNWREVVIAR